MPIYKRDKKNKEGKQQYKVCVNYTDNKGNHRQITKLVYGLTEAKDTERKLEESIKSCKKE